VLERGQNYRTKFSMNGDQISTGCYKVVDEGRRIADHQMNMKRSRCEWAKGRDQIREEEKPWDKVRIRYIDVVQIRKGLGPPNFIP
jgi:hypothetical protein